MQSASENIRIGTGRLERIARGVQRASGTVPIPKMLIENLDLVYGIRALQKKGKGLDIPLWTMSRPTAYRLVKRAMDHAGIVGKQATGKGIRLRRGDGHGKEAAANPRIISAHGPHRHQNHGNISLGGGKRGAAGGNRCLGRVVSRGCKPEPPKFPSKPCVLKSWHLSQLTRSIGQQNNRVDVITMLTRFRNNGKIVHVTTLFLLKRGWFYENNSKKDW